MLGRLLRRSARLAGSADRLGFSVAAGVCRPTRGFARALSSASSSATASPSPAVVAQLEVMTGLAKWRLERVGSPSGATEALCKEFDFTRAHAATRFALQAEDMFRRNGARGSASRTENRVAIRWQAKDGSLDEVDVAVASECDTLAAALQFAAKWE